MNTHVESRIAIIYSFRIEFNLDKQTNIVSSSSHLFFTFSSFIFHFELSCRLKKNKMSIIWLMHNVISILMFNIRVNEFEINENQHSMSIRDKIERQKSYSKKRKIKENLNQNKNIKKSRNRLINFTSLKRELKMKKSTNRVAIDRRVRSLKTTKEYINAFVEDQQQIIQKNKNEIIIKR